MFRFNRRKSRSGKLFFRLLERAVAVDPAPSSHWSNAMQAQRVENILDHLGEAFSLHSIFLYEHK
jgi:hypothetical protein